MWFQKDTDKLRQLFTPNEDSCKLTMGEILIGFFKFYLETFNPDKHAISISHPEGSLIDREGYKKEIVSTFAESEIVREDLLKKYDKWTFIIVDTFDRTINVGRAIKRKGNIEKWYFDIYRYTLEHMLTKGELPLTYSVVTEPRGPGCLINKHKLQRQSIEEKAVESTTETGMGQLTINYLVTHAELKCSDCDFTTDSDKSKAVRYILAGTPLTEVKGDSCYIKCGEH